MQVNFEPLLCSHRCRESMGSLTGLFQSSSSAHCLPPPTHKHFSSKTANMTRGTAHTSRSSWAFAKSADATLNRSLCTPTVSKRSRSSTPRTHCQRAPLLRFACPAVHARHQFCAALPWRAVPRIPRSNPTANPDMCRDKKHVNDLARSARTCFCSAVHKYPRVRTNDSRRVAT